jgi:ATP-binding cassette subfamily C (CFTR/MRP) protein 4
MALATPPAWFLTAALFICGSVPPFAYPLASTLAMVANSMATIFLVHNLFFVQPLFARKVRAVLSQIIFAKALRQQRQSRQQFSSGHIINLVSTDLMRVDWFLIFAHSSWYHPLTLACAVVLLYRLVGVPALWGCLALLAIFSVSLLLSRLQSRFRKQINALADSRVGLTRKTLLHIKAAKLQGWEAKLTAKIKLFARRKLASQDSL